MFDFFLWRKFRLIGRQRSSRMILYFLERSKFTKNIPLDNRYEVIIRGIVYRVPTKGVTCILDVPAWTAHENSAGAYLA